MKSICGGGGGKWYGEAPDYLIERVQANEVPMRRAAEWLVEKTGKPVLVDWLATTEAVDYYRARVNIGDEGWGFTAIPKAIVDQEES